MSRTIKMKDIANSLGVSIVTVSKALSGKKGVSDEVREKIKKLAIEMGYQQGNSLKSMKTGGGYNIGIVVPGRYFGKYVSFYWQLYQEVTVKAATSQCFTMLEVISPEMEENPEMPLLIREKKVDGIILMGGPGKKYLNYLKKEKDIPLVCLDFYDKDLDCDAVVSNGFYGTYMLTNLLFQGGHTKIAYVGTLLYTSSITDRYLGYYKSMLEHGMSVTGDSVLDDRDWETGDVASFPLKFPEKMPTAFVCNSDLTAFALIRRLQEKGYRIPEDVSVVGFDNYLYPGLCNIGITTYDVNVSEMAEKAISTLVAKINNPSRRFGITVVDGCIVQKESVSG